MSFNLFVYLNWGWGLGDEVGLPLTLASSLCFLLLRYVLLYRSELTSSGGTHKSIKLFPPSGILVTVLKVSKHIAKGRKISKYQPLPLIARRGPSEEGVWSQHSSAVVSKRSVGPTGGKRQAGPSRVNLPG